MNSAPAAQTPGFVRPGRSLGDYVEAALPRIVLGPTLLIALIFIYGFILWTGWLSFTESRLLPRYEFAGLVQYIALFDNERWWTALRNLAIFGTLFIAVCLATGLLLAILLDQRIRAEGFLRSVYLYPMALSFIVTGTAWKWILNPGLGLEHLVRQWGWENFTFDWIVTPGMSIYTVVIAGAWQSSGFVMALFLAGLRGIDDSIIKAAQVDGASTVRIYTSIIIPIAAAGVLQRDHHPRPHRHQELRPGGGAHRRRSRLLLRPARDLHVHLRLQPQPDRIGRGERHDDADDHHRRAGAADVLGAAEAAPWLSANAARAQDRTRPAA